MKVEDIIVGQRYYNSYCPGDIWLGIGMRKLFTENEFVEKHLVLIESISGPQYIGRMMQEGENAREGTWDMFAPADSEDRFYIVQGR